MKVHEEFGIQVFVTDVDANLVKLIAAQVMAALRGAGVGGGNGEGAAQVEVHAPIGICTGDYSKFAELKGIQTAPPPIAGLGDKIVSAPAAAERVTALSGVVTVSQLRAVKGNGGVVRLAKGAILSPAAQDFIREKKMNVVTDFEATAVRVNAGSGGNVGVADAATFWWIEGRCSNVAKIVEVLRPNVLASREKGSSENLRNVVSELSALIKTKRVIGGILFAGSAARAVCYANRCANLRAIVATNDRSVSEGIEHLGANVLVVEYPAFGYDAMLGMIKPFVGSMHTAPVGVDRELHELRNCG